MKKIKTISLVIAFLCLYCNALSYAMDWKSLHEKANNISIEQAAAQPNVQKNKEGLYILAIAYFNNHMDKKALDCFERILELDPDSISAKWGIAEFQRRIYKYDIAEESLKKIINDRPDFCPAYISLAYIKYIQTDFEEVVKLMATVINYGLKNTNLTTHVRAHCLYAGAKGMIAYSGGPISKIVNGPAVFRHLKIAQKLFPECVAVHFGFGCYYLLRQKESGQDLNKAEKHLKRAITIDPLFADGYVRLSQVYHSKGDFKKSGIFLNKALEIDPENLLAVDIISKKCKFICDWQ